MKLTLLFPGQGSQTVGMGKDLAAAFPEARYIFQEVDDALEQGLSRLMFEGPQDDLTLTENAQPALMAVSLAVLRVLRKEGNFRFEEKVAFVAGHSLGEYSALAAASAFDIVTAARLLRIRGRAMQEAVPAGIGAMAALLGLDLPAVEIVAKEAAEVTGMVCECANDNAPGQVVVSGHREAISKAIEIASQKGAKRSVLLPVSAPFHCALMAPAAAKMQDALAQHAIGRPVVPVIANVTAEPVKDVTQIADLLVRQVTATVRWRESIGTLRRLGVERVIEVGAGKVLAGLVKRIDKEIDVRSVETPDDIESVLKVLG